MNYSIQKIGLTGILISTGLFYSICFSGDKNSIAGNYNGEKYVLLPEETKDNSASGTNWRLRLGNLPAIAINPATTSWGPAYSDEIFAGAPHEYIADDGGQYNNEAYAPGKKFIAYSILYVSPAMVSKTQFESYCHFMKNEWNKIDSMAGARGYTTLPHIIGLAYGTREDFAQEFYGEHAGKKMIVRIEADGRVRFINNDAGANENYNGLSIKVQMPGKKLSFDTKAAGLTIDQLNHFKNKQDEPLSRYFNIVPGRELVNDQMDIESKLCYKWHAEYMQARGRRQPLEQGTDESYMWFKGDGTFEDFAPNAIRNGTWRYDAGKQLLKTMEDSIVTDNTIQSITEKELVLTSKNGRLGDVSLVFKRIN